MSRNWSEKTEPKKQIDYASFDWRKKPPTGRKIYPAMAVTKRSMPSRNDVLISRPEPILDGAYKLRNVIHLCGAELDLRKEPVHAGKH